MYFVLTKHKLHWRCDFGIFIIIVLNKKKYLQICELSITHMAYLKVRAYNILANAHIIF